MRHDAEVRRLTEARLAYATACATSTPAAIVGRRDLERLEEELQALIPESEWPSVSDRAWTAVERHKPARKRRGR